MSRLFFAMASVLLPLALSAPAAEAQQRTAPATLFDGHAQTCTHFGNRARFMSGAERDHWLARAADACDAALRRGAAQDEALLKSLTALRLTIRSINAERAFGVADPGPRALPVASSASGWTVRSGNFGAPVSRSGEYLIARELGALTALRTWESASE